MQIILLERVEKLGQLGEVVTVKPGYARNYLLPTGKALRANKVNIEKFEAERAEREARNADERGTAQSKAKAVDGLSVALVRAASEMGQLFGSVTARDIANAAVEAGHEVDKRQVKMDKSIKTLGLFSIRLALHAEVDATITVNVARSLDEAETQARTGHAVVAGDDGDAAENEETDAGIKAESEVEPEAESDVNSGAKADAETEADVKPEAETGAETKPETEMEADAETEAETVTEPEDTEADSKEN